MRDSAPLLFFNIVLFQTISIPPPQKGFILTPPHPSGKFQLSFIHFFKFFGLIEPPTPQETPIPSVGGGGEMDVFWNPSFFLFYVFMIVFVLFI